MSAPSNFADAALESMADGVSGARLLDRPRGTRLVSAVWRLEPGATSGPYHLHHATEELLVVVEGEPVVRTPEGERQLKPGDVVHFPVGAAGAHQVLNRSDVAVRYLMFAAHATLDIIECVDERRVIAYSHRTSLLGGESLVVSHELTPEER